MKEIIITIDGQIVSDRNLLGKDLYLKEDVTEGCPPLKKGNKVRFRHIWQNEVSVLSDVGVIYDLSPDQLTFASFLSPTLENSTELEKELQTKEEKIKELRIQIIQLESEKHFIRERLIAICPHKEFKIVGSVDDIKKKASFMNEGGPSSWKECLDCGFKFDYR